MADYVQLPGGLIVPASFAEPSKKLDPPNFNEVATTRDGRDITRGFVDPMLQLLPQDTVLALRGNYNYDLYREVLRDDQVQTGLQQRRLSVVEKEWEVTPGGKRPIDIEAAEFLREQLQALNFDHITEKMHYGVFYGYAVAEVLWAKKGARVVIDAIKVRDRRRFIYDGHVQLRLVTMTNMIPGELLGDRKFWVFATGADHDDEPYGLGLAHWLYWPVFFKRGGIKLWLTFLDKFGAPTATGKYPANATPDEKQRLLSALRAVTSESGVIIPEGMAIELLEAARSGSASYTDLYDRMNNAIAKVIVGQLATSEGTAGKLGNDDAQQSVLNSIVKADSDLICTSFNRTVVRWLTEYNFPGAVPPSVWRIVDEDEDLNSQAERDKKLSDMGFRPTEERVLQVYGPGYERVEQKPRSPAREADFAELLNELRGRSTAGDIEQLESEAQLRSTKKWERMMRKRVEQLVALAEDSGDMQTFRERLAELAAEPPDPSIVEEFTNTGVIARLLGRWRGTRGEF